MAACGSRVEQVWGSTFHFTIPLKPLADGAPVPWGTRRPHLAGRRVLVLEDNDTNRRVLTYWLEKFGILATAVTTAHEALERLQQENAFDGAIIDFQLPEMDGLSFAEAARKLPGGRSLHLWLLTSLHLRAGDSRAAATGVSVSIYKPIRPEQLLRALSQSFDRSLTSLQKAPAALMFNPSFALRLPLRILMADDNRVNQKVGKCFLEKLGYRADVVGNGLEVLQALERQPYDLVFLDVQMPEMDGYEAARQLRRRWTGSDRPRLIAMTGNAMQGDKERCLKAGMDDYIAKPMRAEDLCTALERWGRRS